MSADEIQKSWKSRSGKTLLELQTEAVKWSIAEFKITALTDPCAGAPCPN